MKLFNIVSISLLAITVISSFSCNPEYYGEPNNNKKVISSYSADNSHKNGANCMDCHISGGEGEGIFTVAGSVYDSTKTGIYPNATIELYTESNGRGSLISTLEVDLLGNFYTTEDVDFGSGLFPMITGTGSDVHYMPEFTLIGTCNSCHGVTVDKSWVK